jgi:hypothetical protein
MAKKNTSVESLLVRGLRDTFEPLVNALNEKPALLMEASADTGHAIPATLDGGLRILLGQLCQTVYRQQYGTIRTNIKKQEVRGIDGPRTVETFNTIANNDMRLKKSEQDIAQLQQEIAEDKTSLESKYAISTLHWFGVNEARFNACGELLSSLTTLYRDIFNEEWKPLEDKTPGATAPVNKTAKADVSEEDKKKYEEAMKKAMSRVNRAA